MKNSPLTPYRIVGPDPHGPIGWGVTAFSLEDALWILRQIGYVLPDDPSCLKFVENVRFDDLESWVKRMMCPIAVRGCWYPPYVFGVPNL